MGRCICFYSKLLEEERILKVYKNFCSVSYEFSESSRPASAKNKEIYFYTCTGDDVMLINIISLMPYKTKIHMIAMASAAGGGKLQSLESLCVRLLWHCCASKCRSHYQQGFWVLPISLTIWIVSSKVPLWIVSSKEVPTWIAIVIAVMGASANTGNHRQLHAHTQINTCVVYWFEWRANGAQFKTCRLYLVLGDISCLKHLWI